MSKEKEKQALNFVKNLDNFLSDLFSKGVYQPTDICVCLLLMIEGKNRQKSENIFKYAVNIDHILDKLSLTTEEFVDSVDRLQLKGVLKASVYEPKD